MDGELHTTERGISAFYDCNGSKVTVLMPGWRDPASEAGLLAEIDRLGTNLLTVGNRQNLLGQPAELPPAAPGMISRIGQVTSVQYTGAVDNVNAYHSPF